MAIARARCGPGNCGAIAPRVHAAWDRVQFVRYRRRVAQPGESRIGPWLVALGAALWGTESAWRIPLVRKFDVDVLVFWEHVGMVLLALPLILPRLGELRKLRKTTLAWLLFSGAAGSALGAELFSLALKYAHEGGNPHDNETVINVVLNIQPVLSTTVAVLLFGDKLGRMFPLWAGLAVISGMCLVGLGPGLGWSINLGIAYALAVALCWGLSTVAGRAVMVEMSLPLAAGLRVTIGLVCMAILVGVRGLFHAGALWPSDVETIDYVRLVLLITLSGWLPLVVYFRGLALTRASTAGYFEMMQTIAAVIVTWGFFAAPLEWWQALAGGILIFAVAMVQRAQESAASSSARGDTCVH